ncbi:cytochrome P450 2G1-like [Mantella aurantiaca]
MWLFSAVLIIVLLCLICIAWTKGKTKDATLLPPGPLPLPLLGNILQMRPDKFLVTLQKFQKKYGPVFTVHFGTRPAVMLCEYDIIKEALIDQKYAFSGRGKMALSEYVLKGYGITASNGERWQQMRRFALTNLRNFGMGKRTIEEKIQMEAQILVNEFGKTEGKPFNPTFLVSCAVSNIICSIAFGKHFNYNDEYFLALLHNINSILRFMNSGWSALLYNFVWIMPYMIGPPKRGAQYLAELKAFVDERVKESQRTLDPSSPRHFVDCFLIRMQEEKDNPDTEFHMQNLVASASNLLFAGTETISTTLRYGFLILIKYPEIQAKVQNEIDQVIGIHCPSAEDRTKMPYTEAVIHEIQRFSDIIPTGLPHCTTEDVLLRGFLIPKGTDVFPLLTTVLKDPEQFPDPEMFSPDRFIDNNGELKKHPALLPFSTGRRICPGESLARMELFLFFTTLLQRFTLTTTVPQEDLDLTPEVSSAGHLPRSYKMCVIPRISTLLSTNSN